MMARKPKVQVVEEVEDDEVEELEVAETDDDEDEDTESGTLTAKAAASKLGTDGRTLRKFLRHKFGLVGQGQRWSIDEDKLDALGKEFKAWNKGSKKPPKKKQAAPEPDEELDDAELEELEEIEELDLDDDD